MKELENIHAAFLPINQPYTMTAEMVADAAAAFKPQVVYPYHYELGTETDLAELPGLMKGVDGVDLNILKE
jgi:L-ascorbate metabolism protein UlaG (beta-lactamase superfamily)